MYDDKPDLFSPKQFQQNQYDNDSDNDENEVDPDFLEMVDAEYELDEEDDLYALLGVDRSATEADLKSAYRKMSKNLHPDKHEYKLSNKQYPSGYEDYLSVAFAKISNAYKILMDPRQRKIYDSYGISGLTNYKWDLSVDHESPAKLRLEYIRLRNKELENKMNEITQPNSNFTMSIDARDLFDRYIITDDSAIDGDENLVSIDPPDIRIFQAFIHQSIILGFSAAHRFRVSGSVISHKGIGFNTFDVSWDYQSSYKSIFSGSLIRTIMSYGKNGCFLTLTQRIQRIIFQRSFVYASYQLGFKSNDTSTMLLPSLTFGTNVELTPNLIGSLEYTALLNGGLTGSLKYTSSNYSIGTKAFIYNQMNAGIGVNISKMVDWPMLSAPIGTSRYDDSWITPERKRDMPSWADPDEFREFEKWTSRTRKGSVFADMNLTTNDLVRTSFGARCFIARYTQVSFKFTLSLIQGLSIKIDVFRGSQSYSIPIILSQRYDNYCAFGYGLTIPLLTFISVRYLIYETWLKKELYRAEKHRRNKLKDELVKKRQSACVIQDSLAYSSAKNKAHEESIGGLVIVKALYGVLDMENPIDNQLVDEGGPLSIDVTIALQSMVQNSQIILAPIKMSNLQGFYDPALGLNISANSKARNSGKERQIVIKYYFHKKLHLVCTNESSGLAIPMTKHLI